MAVDTAQAEREFQEAVILWSNALATFSDNRVAARADVFKAHARAVLAARRETLAAAIAAIPDHESAQILTSELAAMEAGDDK